MTTEPDVFWLICGYAAIAVGFAAYIVSQNVREDNAMQRQLDAPKASHVFRTGISEHKTTTTHPDGTVREEYAYLSLNIPEKV